GHGQERASHRRGGGAGPRRGKRAARGLFTEGETGPLGGGGGGGARAGGRGTAAGWRGADEPQNRGGGAALSREGLGRTISQNRQGTRQAAHGALLRARRYRLRLRSVGSGSVLLSSRQNTLPRSDVLRRVARSVGRLQGRILAGLRHRSRGRPSR